MAKRMRRRADPAWLLWPRHFLPRRHMEEFLVSFFVSGWGLTALSVAAYSVGAAVVIHILRQRKAPMAMLAWILGILTFPLIGVLLYYVIGEERVVRRGRKKRRKSAYIIQALGSAGQTEAKRDLLFKPHDLKFCPVLEGGLLRLAQISGKLAQSPLTLGNKVEVFTSAQSIYDHILRAIDGAREHIHLEYYIFRPDETGALFRDRLAEKARRGVEVRLLLDGIGCFGTSRRFLRPLIEAGGRVETFLPAIPLRQPWHINCRNHRKIVVVDGEVAFTGSQNVGDEYRGRWRRVGPWKDTHLRVEGPAARELQEVFIEDWYFACKEDLVGKRYLKSARAAGESLVQIVPSGPDQPVDVLHHVVFAAIGMARESIRISTPYFVPDPALLVALANASHQGVRVEILIPSKNDLKLVLWAGRSFYEELVREGVSIHEFDHGMLHSKTIVIDDRWSMVGSANMDMRSFVSNFEVTASIFDPGISVSLAADFANDLSRSRRIRARKPGHAPFVPSILEGGARLLAPLL